jgi:arabinogalactan endo-1,4-beta-galactosidase
MKKLIHLFLNILPLIALPQSIEVTSFNQNPLEISPLLGGNLQVNIKYTSASGNTANNLYIGLEELNNNNQFVRTVDGVSLVNQTAGTNIERTINLFVGSVLPLSADLPTGHYYQVIARLYTNTWTEIATAGYWNTLALVTQNTIGYNFSQNPINKGADVSWMTEMQANGFVWKDNDGNTKQLMPLLKEYDLNAIRLRVWVNPENSPANGWCDIEDLVNKAILAKNESMDIMICIHYSDHWADPGQQNKPAAWTSFTIAQLETAVANHTTNILNALNAAGITPKWVQIGNETNDGMLWTTGKASLGNFNNYAKFLNAGSLAVKTFNSNIQTILHLANGDNNALFNWNIGGLINNGLVFSRFDIIGMSLYPELNNWKAKVDATYSNMINLKTTYNKDVMMVEVGFLASKPVFSYQFLIYMIEKTRQAQGLGVLYWEPIAHLNWNSYLNGAWDIDGSPSLAMNAFLDSSTLAATHVKKPIENYIFYPNPSNDFLSMESLNNVINSIEIFDLKGQLIQLLKFDSTKILIDVSNLEGGIYMLKIDGKQSIKFIKEK